MFEGEFASLDAMQATNTVRVPRPVKVRHFPCADYNVKTVLQNRHMTPGKEFTMKPLSCQEISTCFSVGGAYGMCVSSQHCILARNGSQPSHTNLCQISHLPKPWTKHHLA